MFEKKSDAGRKETAEKLRDAEWEAGYAEVGLWNGWESNPPGQESKGMVAGCAGKKERDQHVLYGAYRTRDKNYEPGNVC